MNFMKDAIDQMRPYVTPPIEEPRIKLNQNESPYNLPKELVEKIAERLKATQFNRYNEGSLSKLREIVARKLSLRNDRVLFGCGIDEIFYYIMLAFVEKGEKVVRPIPSFGMYEICARISGAKDVPLLLGEDFELTEQFIEECKDAKLVFLCRPNSQTGNSWNKRTIERIITTTKGIICIDEAYAEFADDDCLEFLKYDNVIITRTFSKVYSAALIRLGYALASQEIIEALNRVRLPWNVSGITELIGETILENESMFMKRRDKIVENREELFKELSRITAVYPSNANFLTFKVPNPKETYALLLACGIQVRDVSMYPLLSGCLRVTVGSKEENALFVKKLERILGPPEAIIFDIDGVLVDVSNSYREAIKRTVGTYRGRPATNEEIEAIKKLPNSNNDWAVTYAIVKGISKDLGQIDRTTEEFIRMQKTFQEFYLGGLIDKESLLIETTLLEDLKRLGFKVGVVTSRPRDEAIYALERIGGFEPEFVIAQEDCGEEKPSGKPIQKLLLRMGVSRALYVGDTINDRLAARAAGIGYEEVDGKKTVNEIVRRLLK